MGMKALAVALTVTACGPRVVRIDRPVPMTVVAPVTIANEKSSCYIDELPEPPEELTLLMEESDVVRRVFVHIRDHNAALEWMKQAHMVHQQVIECLAKLAP